MFFFQLLYLIPLVYFWYSIRVNLYFLLDLCLLHYHHNVFIVYNVAWPLQQCLND